MSNMLTSFQISVRGYILVAGCVETDPTDGSVGSLVVPAVGKSGLHTSPQ